jgi:hypothetical protein
MKKIFFSSVVSLLVLLPSGINSKSIPPQPSNVNAKKVLIPNEELVCYWFDGERLFFRKSEIK